jgi:hypothetical protein
MKKEQRMKAVTTFAFAAALMFGATHLSAANQQLTGVVSDSMCGASHMAKDKTAAECTRMCVKDGSKYGLVVGDKVYTLSGHEAELDKLAGEKATIKGDVSGTDVKVSSGQSAKSSK